MNINFQSRFSAQWNTPFTRTECAFNVLLQLSSTLLAAAAAASASAAAAVVVVVI